MGPGLLVHTVADDRRANGVLTSLGDFHEPGVIFYRQRGGAYRCGDFNLVEGGDPIGDVGEGGVGRIAPGDHANQG